MKILKECNKAIVKTIEQKIKNKFSWKWPSNISRGEDLNHKGTTQTYSHVIGKLET